MGRSLLKMICNRIAETTRLGRLYPTSLWVKGEYVSDTILINTRGAMIGVGWYVPETGERVGRRYG